MDEEETELRNPFPSPPSHYQNYTIHNLKLLSLLRERVGPEETNFSNVNQRSILFDQSDVPEWPLVQLEKPRVDWIIEDGHYTVFGDTWQVSLTFRFPHPENDSRTVDQRKNPIVGGAWRTPVIPF